MLSFCYFWYRVSDASDRCASIGGFIDKYGRKRGLLVTLGLMAFGTFTIAFTPDYSQIELLHRC